MFTGIISAVGEIASIDLQAHQGAYRFVTGKLDMADAKLGDSIAVNGACLTVTELHDDGFSADLSGETLECTTFGERKVGDPVNLERALRMGESLGGHLVTGHVDGVGTVRGVESLADALRIRVEVPGQLARYVAPKGSICIDGISLTVNGVENSIFDVMIVPHTQEETIIANYRDESRVNIEVDMIARYLERIVQYTDRS